jgi:hypothetical protein
MEKPGVGTPTWTPRSCARCCLLSPGAEVVTVVHLWPVLNQIRQVALAPVVDDGRALVLDGGQNVCRFERR